MSTLRIAIVFRHGRGAGISGLVLSAALDFLDRERKFEIKIYESSKQLTDIGAGINFWSRTWEVFKGIGLDEKLEAILAESPPDPQSIRTVFQIRKADQKDGVYIQDLKMKGKSMHSLRLALSVINQGGYIRFRRADLQKVLCSRVRGELHMSHRLLSYEESDNETMLHFENGSVASCDLLIGADGIRSAVRRCFLNKQDPSRSLSLDPIFWSGEYVFRGLVEIERLQAEFPGHRACSEPVIYIGKYRFIVAYRVSLDNIISVGAFMSEGSTEGSVWQGPPSVPCSLEEVLASFLGWEPEVAALLKCIQRPMKLAIQTMRPMKCYAKSNIILVGDAAHPVTPHQGAGGGLAVEDSYILANLLSSRHCTKSTISKVSEIYNMIRCGPGNDVLERARISGKLFSLTSPKFKDVTEGDTSVPLGRLTELMDEIGENWAWIWKDDVEGNRRRALEMLVKDTERN